MAIKVGPGDAGVSQRAGFRVSAVRDVVVPLPFDEVLASIRDIELLEPLERKARHVEIHPTSPDAGWSRSVGTLFRVKAWEGNFRYQQHGNGWHSEDLAEREDGWRISGGFLVSRIDDVTCRVTHYEDYLVPPRLRPLRVLLNLYMRRSQIGEMRDLGALLQCASRQTSMSMTH
ncbi:MAG: hypothetical protein NVS3B21_18790 [Acidimicrobiales bacterium]